ncbi:glycine--tRNA ligase [Candidatus Woesearchaeota archaeon]|nr:glycine--tRNA ligase [Candidatus Woesearchaeota archaeon]
MRDTVSIDEISSFCKRKGFVYPSGEVYGSLAGFWDYGHLGVELKNNIKQHWWKQFVHMRDDVVGIDGAIITHPKVWVGSGHADHFEDILVECNSCHIRLRADHLIEDTLHIPADSLSAKKIDEILSKHKVKCPSCQKGTFQPAMRFNLMFSTQVGPVTHQSSKAFLRPETAQLIFTDLRLVQDNARQKLPFGIAQAGKVFRNEISPRDFLFRSREFEIMEIEYFLHPKHFKKCPFFSSIKDRAISVLSAEAQQKNKKQKITKIGELVRQGSLKSEWHAYWLIQMYDWFLSLGVSEKHLRLREHLPDERAHYSSACFDIDYAFPFGWKEIHGCADRTTFDVEQHQILSKKDLRIFDEETKEKVIPYVIEPSQGFERAFLAFIFEAYNYDKKRGYVVLHLHPSLAPYKAGIFPLVQNNDKLVLYAREVYVRLKDRFVCFWDQGGSVGRRYARADEQGVPFCITVDFDSLKDKSVTIRDRDSTKQIRIPVSELVEVLENLLAQKISFKEGGKLIN